MYMSMMGWKGVWLRETKHKQLVAKSPNFSYLWQRMHTSNLYACTCARACAHTHTHTHTHTCTHTHTHTHTHMHTHAHTHMHTHAHTHTHAHAHTHAHTYLQCMHACNDYLIYVLPHSRFVLQFLISKYQFKIKKSIFVRVSLN